MEENDAINMPAPYPKVQPDIRDWPIYQLTRDREQLVADVVADAMDKLYQNHTATDLQLVADTYYQERIRITEEPWKVDPPDEMAFYKEVKQKLQKAAAGKEGDPRVARELMQTLVERYTEEIVGSFKLGAYRFARGLTNYGFSRVFNTFSKGLFRSFKAQRRQLVQKMQITGEIDKIRQLATKGTVVLVPTHFSNLDSIVVGWAIEAMGLPAFTYGAGINLFGHPLLSYFMHRLGAYRVDRRKKNEIYLTVLKTYSEHIVRRGAHTLFFPGGTRSRSGGIESRLKLGLLGTTLEAQRKLVLDNPENPETIFVVPLVMSYHNVIEAPNLIEQHFRREWKQRYVLVKDNFRSMQKNMSFLWNFLSSSSEMVFSFGEPRDLFGNRLDDEGRSITGTGERVQIADYFRSEGVITHDKQRNAAYTRLLGERILKSYYEINIVFNSHLVAFAAFQYIKQSEGVDLYRLFTRSESNMLIPENKFVEIVSRLMDQLREMDRNGQVQLAKHLRKPISEIIEEGIENLSGYHVESPLYQKKNGHYGTQNLKLLYYYHNRLNGYELHRFIN